jgi:hypothetical protein
LWLSVVEAVMNAAFARRIASGLGFGLLAAGSAAAMTPAAGALGPRSRAAIRISISVAPRMDFSRLEDPMRSGSAAGLDDLRLPRSASTPGGLGYAIVADSAPAAAPTGQPGQPPTALARGTGQGSAPLMLLVVPD